MCQLLDVWSSKDHGNSLTFIFLLCQVSSVQCSTSPAPSVWAQRPCFLCSQVSPCQAPFSFPRKPFSACPGLASPAGAYFPAGYPSAIWKASLTTPPQVAVCPLSSTEVVTFVHVCDTTQTPTACELTQAIGMAGKRSDH